MLYCFCLLIIFKCIHHILTLQDILTCIYLFIFERRIAKSFTVVFIRVKQIWSPALHSAALLISKKTFHTPAFYSCFTADNYRILKWICVLMHIIHIAFISEFHCASVHRRFKATRIHLQCNVGLSEKSVRLFIDFCGETFSLMQI